MSEEKQDKKEVSKTYSGKIATKETQKIGKEKTKNVTFKYNRKFELHIGRNMETFLGRETKPIPVSWLAHKDWQNVAKYFNIKGV